MIDNIIAEVSPAVNLQFVTAPQVVKVRDNVFVCDDLSIVVAGPLYAPGGFLLCLSCEDVGCEHCHEVFDAWLDGRITQEQYIPFNGTGVPLNLRLMITALCRSGER